MLPEKYKYLLNEDAPKVLVKALKFYGTKEIKGSKHNPVIMSWAKELKLKDYNSDEVSWCGLYVAKIVSDAGYKVVKDPLWARNWLNFGVKQQVAMLGDILVFTRDGGMGHVGLYVGEDNECYNVLGGNQSDSVSITRILKSRCIGIRRCPFKEQPKNVRVIKLGTNGPISTNEA